MRRKKEEALAVEKETTSLSSQPETRSIVATPEQVELIKSVIAPKINDDELKLFLYECQRRGVHPLDRMIHPVIYDTKYGRRMSFQVSIDYLRAKAESSGKYDGQDQPIYETTDDGHLLSATVVVYKKGIAKGIAATAYFSEYCPQGGGGLWGKMPRLMLAKCAEALALRKAFPDLLSGVYTFDEMNQAETRGEEHKSPLEIKGDDSIREMAIDAETTKPSTASSEKDDEMEKCPQDAEVPTQTQPEPEKDINPFKRNEQKASQSTKPSAGTISVPQQKRFHAIGMAYDVSAEERKSILKDFGYEKTEQVKWQDYDKIINTLIAFGEEKNHDRLIDELNFAIEKSGLSIFAILSANGIDKTIDELNVPELKKVISSIKLQK